MNKRYMDFVPSKATKPVVKPKAKVAVKPVAKTVPMAKAGAKVGTGSSMPRLKRAASNEPKPETVKSASGAGVPMLGMIEEMDVKFVNTDVPKRPLSVPTQVGQDKLAAVKAKKIRSQLKSAVAGKEKPMGVSSATKPDEAYKVPKSPFINQGKVAKRPLSKNVYQKKVEAPKEEPKGPVTIIAKPEKDKHIGVIVTIILTIILGAAAGTVAFLLLPK